jgi:hypothetical protein
MVSCTAVELQRVGYGQLYSSLNCRVGFSETAAVRNQSTYRDIFLQLSSHVDPTGVLISP